jgi:hypothetical protein
MANAVKRELEAERCDDEFEKFWDEVEDDRIRFKVEQSTLTWNSIHTSPIHTGQYILRHTIQYK